MFKIYDGRDYFYQWDTDRKIIVEDKTITQVHFCNRTDDCSLVCEVYDFEGARLVNVPNVLLQSAKTIRVYAYCGFTKIEERFRVNQRSKPADYAYTETEILNYSALDQRIKALENGSGGGGSGADLSDYYTKAEVNEAISKAQPNLEPYALKTQIPDVSAYQTEAQVNDLIYLAMEGLEDGYY